MAFNLEGRLAEEAKNVPNGGHLGVLPCEDRENGLYPKVDLAIWLRSCIEEVSVPLKGQLIGGILPKWLKGNLLMNGPGKFYFGTDVFQHLFDGSALIQKYAIAEDGQVYYQCKFLRTKSFVQVDSYFISIQIFYIMKY